jgi:putative transposase
MQTSFLRLKTKMAKNRFSKMAGYSKSGLDYESRGPSEFDEKIRQETVRLAWEHPTFGTPFVTALLKKIGYPVNHKRIEAIWQQESLQGPRRAPRRKTVGTPWQRDIVATRPNEVWAYDFVFEKTRYGKKAKILAIVDECSRESVALHAADRMNSEDVKRVLDQAMFERGAPKYIRSDNGSEFKADHLCEWLKTCGVTPLFVDPASPWQNGFAESFNGTMRHECLDRETWGSRTELAVVLKWWRQFYNDFRPHSSLSYKTPSEFAKAAFASLKRPLDKEQSCL